MDHASVQNMYIAGVNVQRRCYTSFEICSIYCVYNVMYIAETADDMCSFVFIYVG